MKSWFVLAVALVLSAALGGHAAADWRVSQPQLTSALNALQLANTRLSRVSTPDRSGHRRQALYDLRQAIVQVRAEMEYDRVHRYQPN